MLAAFIKRANTKPGARRGFTLTELSIVLGVIGLILGAIWVAADQAYNNQKTQKAAAQVLQIVNGYKMLYGQHGIDVAGCYANPQDDLTCMGVNAGYFPSDMLPSVTCVTDNVSTYPKSPWNGQVVASTCQSNNTINVAYYGLSRAACISLASAIYTSSPAMTYQAIAPDGQSWTDQWLPPYGTNTPWTITQLNALCGAGTTNALQIGIAAK